MRGYSAIQNSRDIFNPHIASHISFPKHRLLTMPDIETIKFPSTEAEGLLAELAKMLDNVKLGEPDRRGNQEYDKTN